MRERSAKHDNFSPLPLSAGGTWIENGYGSGFATMDHRKNLHAAVRTLKLTTEAKADKTWVAVHELELTY